MTQTQTGEALAAEGTPVIELRHVDKHFGSLHVLKDINLKVGKGEVVVVIGPSGSGKSTLCRTINRLETIDTGEVLIEGKPLPQEGKELAAMRAEIGMVFQSFNLFAHRSIIDNVTMGPVEVLGVPRDKAREEGMELLRRVGVAEQAEKMPAQLSGGQQQRVAIARAVVNEPRVLLLDEPLSALDRKLRRSMQLELIKIKEELGITFVFVTHDQEEALSMSDTVVVMNQGYIQQIGTPENIYNEPENAFVADFIGDSNIVDGLMVHDKLVRIADYDFDCVDVGFGTNRPVDVQIRPEDMELRPPQDGGFNGVVTKTIFEGMTYNLTIQARGIEWLVKSTKHYQPGDEVSLWVDPFNIQIMNKPESEDERAMEND